MSSTVFVESLSSSSRERLGRKVCSVSSVKPSLKRRLKRCRYSKAVCTRSSCDVFDLSSGNIRVCEKHGNPKGRDRFRGRV